MRRGEERSEITDDLKFTICILKSDERDYDLAASSFTNAGFSETDCQYLVVDNTNGNTADAYAGYNHFLLEARGRYVVLCHQDVLLIEDRHDLEARLAELSHADPLWAVAGNAGSDDAGTLHIRISDPYGENQKIGGPFPRRVVSLDENFIVVRREANLALSRDLSGFHLYGTDLCLIAEILGWTCYVIDFHIRHKSAGNPDLSFQGSREAMQIKYQAAFRTRWVPNVLGYPVYLTASPWRRNLVQAALWIRRKRKDLVGIVVRR